MNSSKSVPSEEYLFQVTGEVGTFTFNRPQARNALTFAMYDGLKAVCDSLAHDKHIKVLIIIGGDERAFAAGTDISQFRDLRTEEEALAYEARIDSVLGSLERCPLPIIAAISGACTGGGAAIAAACDLRVATRDSLYGFPISRTLGNCLSATSLRRLSGLISLGRIKEMIFTSRLIGAEEALNIGLITELVDDHPHLLARVEQLASLLCDQAPLTLTATKEAIRRLQTVDSILDQDLVTLCYTSEDFREGIEAFLGKRKPIWKGD